MRVLLLLAAFLPLLAAGAPARFGLPAKPLTDSVGLDSGVRPGPGSIQAQDTLVRFGLPAKPLTDSVDLSLAAAFRLALNRSPARVEAGVSRAQSGLRLAQGIGMLLPSASGSLSYGEARTRSLLFPESTVTTEGWTGTLTLSQVVFDPQVFASVCAAFAWSGYYAADAQDKQARLVLDVTSDYLNLLKARLMRDAARSALDRAEENLTLARTREDLGALSEIEVMRAEVFRSQAELSLLSADRALDASGAALLATLGIEDDVPVRPTEVLTDEPGTMSDPDSLLAEIERRNPGARLAARAGTAAAFGLAGAIGQALPSVSAFWRSTCTDTLLPRSVRDWDDRDDVSFGLSFSFPLLDLKSYVFGVLNASTEARRARAAAARARLSLRSAAVAAVSGYAEARQRLDYAERNLRLNDELYRLAQTQHRLGALSSADFYGVETGLQQARAGRIAALCDTYIQAAQIGYLLGRTGLPEATR